MELPHLTAAIKTHVAECGEREMLSGVPPQLNTVQVKLEKGTTKLSMNSDSGVF